MNYSKYWNKNIGMKLGIFDPLGITRVQLQDHRNRKQVIWRSNGFNMNFLLLFLSFLFFFFSCSVLELSVKIDEDVLIVIASVLKIFF